jgi:YgiT-type zinc finger domain-containing protein
MENECWECGKELIEQKVDYTFLNIVLGKFLALVCPSCNEILFREKTSREITKKVNMVR